VTVNLNIKLTLDGAPVARALAPLLDALKEQIVSKLSDAVEAVKAAATDCAARVAEDVAELRRQLDELKVLVENGGATDEILAKLAEAKATSDGINPLPDFPPATPAP
jgi:hypothetical protein